MLLAAQRWSGSNWSGKQEKEKEKEEDEDEEEKHERADEESGQEKWNESEVMHEMLRLSFSFWNVKTLLVGPVFRPDRKCDSEQSMAECRCKVKVVLLHGLVQRRRKCDKSDDRLRIAFKKLGTKKRLRAG